MPLWACELAERFWDEVGGRPPWPRRLRPALKAGPYEVAVKELANLTIHKAENHLAHMGIFYRSGEPDRSLRACVASQRGAAWIYLDANDTDEEKEASLAHEVAHFLRHCLEPRRRAVSHLGPRSLDVLNGTREPSPAMQLRALLCDVPLGTQVHYLRREVNHVPSAERRAEAEADLLAWQLLAPVDAVLAHGVRDWCAMVSLLREEFGLSATMADQYAAWLCPERDDSPVVRSLEKVGLNFTPARE